MKSIIFITFAIYSSVLAEKATFPLQNLFKSIKKREVQSLENSYKSGEVVPHATYFNSEIYPYSYDNAYYLGKEYENYNSDTTPTSLDMQQSDISPGKTNMTGANAFVIARHKSRVFQFGLKVLSKVGMSLVHGIMVLFVGGVLTSAVCTFTQFCELSFNGLSTVNREAISALVKQDYINEISPAVEKAISKPETTSPRN